MRDADKGPAIEHAYAATTYQAQGATVESAFVMADPSMDRQEFYVAASRSSGETRLYATPEIQFNREEFAPPSPYLREGLDHIAAAAERDGSQAAAHDAALRSRFADLPSEQLAGRLHELSAEAGAEAANERNHDHLAEELQENTESLRRIRREREELPEPRRWEKKQERWEREWEEHLLNHSERSALERAERLRAEARQLSEVRHEARAESAVIKSMLAERERLAVAAARLSPPAYITRELGERPSDPTKAAEWDKAVRGIEGYRLKNGVVDRDNALGPQPKHDRGYERRDATESIERAQRRLSLHRKHAAERSAGMDIGL
ncbi:MAG: hypothetical protein ACTHN3_14990 [Solirubrobacterales bacterium]